MIKISRKKLGSRCRIFLHLALVLVFTGVAEARQFRYNAPIATPEDQQASLPNDAVAIAYPRAIPRSEVETEIRKLLAKWNTPQMSETLSEQFYDKDRLIDAIGTKVPKDAVMRVQSIQAIQTLQQYHSPASYGVAGKEVTLVSAIVKTQIEFNGSTGLVKLPSTSEFTLEVTKHLK
jgi:hypothetical protein